MTEKNPACTLG